MHAPFLRPACILFVSHSSDQISRWADGADVNGVIDLNLLGIIVTACLPYLHCMTYKVAFFAPTLHTSCVQVALSLLATQVLTVMHVLNSFCMH